MANFNLEIGEKYDHLFVDGQLTGGVETDEFINNIEKTENSNKSIVVDFSGCNFISSIVIGLLLKKHVKFNEMNIKFVVAGLNSTLESVFKMTKMNTILYIEPDFEAAKKYLDK